MLTLPTTPRCPHVASRPARRRPVAVVARLLAVIPLGLPAWAGPPVTLAQGLAELQATQQARQQMEAEAAGAAAGRVQMSDEDASVEPGDAAAGGDATATEGGSGGVFKYLLTYGLLIVFAGLGTFAACRPVRRTAPDGT
jgi:hypothetical protein